MSATMGRVFNSLRRVALNTGELFHNTTTTVRLSSVRPLAMSSQMQVSSKKPNDENVSRPIKFSTSKASHKTWKVDRTMGSHHQQPWWKVLSISLLGVSFVLWCALRGQTGVDEQLNKSLYEHLPSLASDDDDEEEETVQNQSN
ncbi:ubiquinol-cytochrome c reductase complex assembly factor 4 isoform X2 [Sphaeramia orbicularis]|uniref:ubiquinol-cytochrome c reductase complex assembly factor 4 isoform X2 n=1 Tax=Sphaeramia orbicularis TaxID=375764 RepID=UPI00117F7EF1|nr:protein CCSMST1 isoform X2 [Sphaeramia orbicularis]